MDTSAQEGQPEPAEVLIGVTGGSAAGKSTLARGLAVELGMGRVVIVQQDWYYHDLSELTEEERATRNFDEPSALDLDLLCEQIVCLRRGQTVLRPEYDFCGHMRTGRWHRLEPRQVTIVEGTLVLAHERLRTFFDVRVFVDATRDTRFRRRLRRDTHERGRDLDACLEQHRSSVWPMHERYVEPSRAFADIEVTGDGITAESIRALARRIDEIISSRPERLAV